jgi:hypothetical protein
MQEPEQKRLKQQDELLLAEDADHPAIEQWLILVKLQTEAKSYELFAKVFQSRRPTLVDRLLDHLTTIELFNLISKNNFMTVQLMSELITWDTNDLLVAAQKLYIISCRILSKHELLSEENLSDYWKIINSSVKVGILQSLEVRVFISLFTRASIPLSKDIVPYIEDVRWSSLLVFDDYAFIRELVRCPNVDLTLAKLKLLLNNRFREPQQVIILACLKNAVLQNCYEFFEGLTVQYSEYLEILINLNKHDLLITACNFSNPNFLKLFLPQLLSSLRRRTLALLATWLSIELNTLEVEHDHLRNSIIADLNTILLESELLSKYSNVKDDAALKEARKHILKTRSSQLPDNKKRALLSLLTLQVQLNIPVEKIRGRITERANPAQHHSIDEFEINVTKILNEYMGYVHYELPSSQPSQQERYSQLKSTTHEKYTAMRSKKLTEEIGCLQKQLLPYRTNDISAYRRVVMPRLTLEKQYEDVADYVFTEASKSSVNIAAVWVDSLDLSMWDSYGGPRSLISGNIEHQALASALLGRAHKNPGRPMLVASLGFFIQIKGNIKQVVRLPLRIQDKNVVKITPNMDLLTEETDAIKCEHPLNRVIDYLLYGKAITQILQKVFDQNRAPIVTLVRGITLDCHTNSMPCPQCLERAAEAQRKLTIVMLITNVLSSRKIPFHHKYLPLLFRISVQSLAAPMEAQIIVASPRSKLTPPVSQLSPSEVLKQNPPSYYQEGLSTHLMANLKTPVLVNDIAYEAISAPERFQPKCFIKDQEALNIKVLCNHSVVVHKLVIRPENVAHKYSPDISKYTALIGGCGVVNKP